MLRGSDHVVSSREGAWWLAQTLLDWVPKLACLLGMARLNTLRMKIRDLNPRSAKSKRITCLAVPAPAICEMTKRYVCASASGSQYQQLRLTSPYLCYGSLGGKSSIELSCDIALSKRHGNVVVRTQGSSDDSDRKDSAESSIT